MENSQFGANFCSDFSKQSYLRPTCFEPNNLVQLLQKKVDNARDKLYSHRYEMQQKTSIFIDLLGWDITFKHNLVYRLRNYDIKPIFEKPNEARVRKEALEGRITYVVISNNLLEYETNALFL